MVIEHPNRFLLQNHYRNDRGDDIFLFVNASLREAVGSNIAFSKGIYQGRTAWVYNPATDEKQLLQLDEGEFWLYLPPTETLFVIFEDENRGSHSSPKLGEVPEGRRSVSTQEWSPAYNEGQHYFTIPMQWHLTLTHAIEGWTRDTVMQELCDLRETQFKDFSGTIVYTARFHLDSITDDTLQDVTYTPESLEDIDLGQVYDICELTVNGTPCGVRWYGERIYNNLGGLLHAGDNVIEIKVTTTLNNYVHTLTDNGVVQHFVLKRNVPTTPAGLVGPVSFY